MLFHHPVVASLLCQHMEIFHGIVMPQTQGVDINGRVPQTYVVSFPWVLKSVVCPVDRCPAREHNPVRLKENFMYWHWKLKILILWE